MCTAVSVTAADRYFFARTLDLEYHHEESVTLAPRRYPFSFSDSTACTDHPALLGMAYVVDGYPLYYDAMNEHGLCMAGLAFTGFCAYAPQDTPHSAHRLAPWELIPYVLASCRTAEDAKELLSHTVLADIPFSDTLPNHPMHWMLADRTATIVLETDADGRICIYDNPAGVLTNAPSFPEHLTHLSGYEHLTPHPRTDLPSNSEYSVSPRGTGALGLPGDWSSPSRFVRAAFLRRHTEIASAASVFSLLDSLKVPRGASYAENGAPIVTVYSAVMEPHRFCYSYQTEDNPTPRTVTPTAIEIRGSQCITTAI